MFRKITNRYTFNLTYFFINSIFFVGIYYILLNFELRIYQYLLSIPIIVLVLHYNLNLVHLASHSLISRNRKLNSFIGNICSTLGGVTFADFRSTHMLHHKHALDEKLDPDHDIATGRSLFILPFKIWYHDRFFWTRGLWKINNNWRGYVVNRLAQFSVVLLFFVTGNFHIWLLFWMFPNYIVGFLNGLFLFYFPHYTTKLEKEWRLSHSNPVWAKFGLFCIDLSRYYHEMHHEKIATNKNYFPFEDYILNKIVLRNPNKLAWTYKYIDA